MSNIEEKFYDWRERMNEKTDRERHNYALSVAFLFTAIVLFFVVSNWYYIISGENVGSSFFTDIEDIYNNQKSFFSSSTTTKIESN